MIFAIRDLIEGIRRKEVLEDEIKDCMKIWKFVDDQLYAELAIAQCEIDFAKERLIKQGTFIGVSLILSILVYFYFIKD